MSDKSNITTFVRTLPLFDGGDRRIIQQLLHHAVADLKYGHPDRKIARDMYHNIREGDAFRLWISTELEKYELTIDYPISGMCVSDVIGEFILVAEGNSPEWEEIAEDIDQYREKNPITDEQVSIAFEYLY